MFYNPRSTLQAVKVVPEAEQLGRNSILSLEFPLVVMPAVSAIVPASTVIVIQYWNHKRLDIRVKPNILTTFTLNSNLEKFDFFFKKVRVIGF